jgi:hypothetical protein
VAQSYLRRFANENKQIDVFDCELQNKYSSSIRNIASERFFYDSIWDGELQEQLIEKTLGKFETHFSRMLDSIIYAYQNQLAIQDEDKFEFAFGIYVNWYRTKKMRNRINNSDNDYVKATHIFGFFHESFIHAFKIMMSKKTWVLSKVASPFVVVLNDNPIQIEVENPDFDIFSKNINEIENLIQSDLGFKIIIPVDKFHILSVADQSNQSQELEKKINILTPEESVRYILQQVLSANRQIYIPENERNLIKVCEQLSLLRPVFKTLSTILEPALKSAINTGNTTHFAEIIKGISKTVQNQMD